MTFPDTLSALTLAEAYHLSAEPVPGDVWETLAGDTQFPGQDLTRLVARDLNLNSPGHLPNVLRHAFRTRPLRSAAIERAVLAHLLVWFTSPAERLAAAAWQSGYVSSLISSLMACSCSLEARTRFVAQLSLLAELVTTEPTDRVFGLIQTLCPVLLDMDVVAQSQRLSGLDSLTRLSGSGATHPVPEAIKMSVLELALRVAGPHARKAEQPGTPEHRQVLAAGVRQVAAALGLKQHPPAAELLDRKLLGTPQVRPWAPSARGYSETA